LTPAHSSGILAIHSFPWEFGPDRVNSCGAFAEARRGISGVEMKANRIALPDTETEASLPQYAETSAVANSLHAVAPAPIRTPALRIVPLRSPSAISIRRFARVPTHASACFMSSVNIPRASLHLPLRLRSVENAVEKYPVSLSRATSAQLASFSFVPNASNSIPQSNWKSSSSAALSVAATSSPSLSQKCAAWSPPTCRAGSVSPPPLTTSSSTATMKSQPISLRLAYRRITFVPQCTLAARCFPTAQKSFPQALYLCFLRLFDTLISPSAYACVPSSGVKCGHAKPGNVSLGEK